LLKVSVAIFSICDRRLPGFASPSSPA